jgi:hypothetical protein
MVKIKNFSVVTTNPNNIKITDLFNISPTSKYIFLNLLGDNYNLNVLGGGSLIGNKTVTKNYIFPRIENSTVLFELKNGVYTNNTFGDLSNIQISPPKLNNYVNLVTIGLADTVDPGLLFAAKYTSSFIGELTYTQYSASIVNSSSTKLTATANNIVKNALSFVNKTVVNQSDWQFVDLISALSGSSLPLSSFNDYNKTNNNGLWNVEYDGNKPSGDWKSLVSPGDIIMMSDNNNNSLAAVCVSGYGIDAMIVNTSSKYNKAVGTTQVKIASPHLLSDEYLYNNATNDNVFIYSLGNYIDTPISTPAKIFKPATYDSIQVTPKRDFKFSTNQPINISVNDIFSTMNAGSKITLKINNLPTWLKFDSTNNKLIGTSPSSNISKDITINASYGTKTANDTFNINVDKKLLVDIPNTNWMAGTLDYLSINKGTTDKYYYRVTSTHDLSWIKIDQTKGQLYGMPPLEEIGRSYKITVYQQHNSEIYNVDDFTLNITYPVNIIGVPEITNYPN